MTGNNKSFSSPCLVSLNIFQLRYYFTDPFTRQHSDKRKTMVSSCIYIPTFSEYFAIFLAFTQFERYLLFNKFSKVTAVQFSVIPVSTVCYYIFKAHPKVFYYWYALWLLLQAARLLWLSAFCFLVYLLPFPSPFWWVFKISIFKISIWNYIALNRPIVRSVSIWMSFFLM